IGPLNASPLFAAPEFAAPVVKVPGQDGERFTVTAKIGAL
ncbi:MAG: PilN domain-containing protein, partial [Mesorhizobium sp.]